MSAPKKAKKRYSKPQYACPRCGKPYNYAKDCNSCHVKAVLKEQINHDEPKSFDNQPPQGDVIDRIGAKIEETASKWVGMPTKNSILTIDAEHPEQNGIVTDRPYYPKIDLSKSPEGQKSKRSLFNEFMERVYGTLDDSWNLFVKDPSVISELKFSSLEKAQLNDFIFLVLRRWAPNVLDLLTATGKGGEELGIVGIIFAGAFAALIIFKKFRIISSYIALNKPIVTDLPPKYAGGVAVAQ